jgi:hypothetical protein
MKQFGCETVRQCDSEENAFHWLTVSLANCHTELQLHRQGDALSLHIYLNYFHANFLI